MSILNLLSTDGFISVNKFLIKKIGLEQAVIIGELTSEYDYYSKRCELTDDGYFFSTVKNIEERTTIKEKRQRAIMNELEEIGLIHSVKRGLPSKRYIKLNENALINLFSERNKNGQNGGTVTVKMAYKEPSFEATNKNINNKNINNNIKHTQQVAEIELQFEKFWSFYPKKTDKKKAFDKFKLKVKKHDFDTIIKGTASYAKVMQLNNTDKQYIKGAAVFLNNENYLDDQSELLRNKISYHAPKYSPWEEDLFGTEANSSTNENNIQQLPTTTKQIGW